MGQATPFLLKILSPNLLPSEEEQSPPHPPEGIPPSELLPAGGAEAEAEAEIGRLTAGRWSAEAQISYTVSFTAFETIGEAMTQVTAHNNPRHECITHPPYKTYGDDSPPGGCRYRGHRG